MKRSLLSLTLAPALALAACGSPPVEGVSEAWVKLPAVAGRPGAAYFTLQGGPQENRLLEISSPQAIRVEIHESLMQGGMMTMRPIAEGVAVPAGGSVKFEPGGKHAMLYDIAPGVKPGGSMTLRLKYANGRTIEVEAEAKAAGGEEDHAH